MTNFDVLNLSAFRAEALPENKSNGGNQLVLVNGMDMRCYTVYCDEAHAIAEVVYSRLCEMLGLRCVKACFGTGLPEQQAKYMSVSEYSPYWTPLQEASLSGWDKLEEDNLMSWGSHFSLAILLLNEAREEGEVGYIASDGGFIKANNGHLFSLGLHLQSKESKQSFYDSPVSVSNFLSQTDGLPGARSVPRRLAALTDSQIEECLELPGDWEAADKAKEHLRVRLLNARSCAKRIVSAIDDHLNVMLDGL